MTFVVCIASILHLVPLAKEFTVVILQANYCHNISILIWNTQPHPALCYGHIGHSLLLTSTQQEACSCNSGPNERILHTYVECIQGHAVTVCVQVCQHVSDSNPGHTVQGLQLYTNHSYTPLPWQWTGYRWGIFAIYA